MFDFGNRGIAAEKLKELQGRNIPKMTLKKLLEMEGYTYLKSYAGEAAVSEIKACDEHLALYCEAGYNADRDIFSDEKCLFCFGIAHGEMVTCDNGMDRTYYHYLELKGKRHRVEILLQYHPSCYYI